MASTCSKTPFKIVGVNLDLGFFDFGKNNNCGCGSLDSASFFCHRHALDPMNSGFVFEAIKYTRTSNFNGVIGHLDNFPGFFLSEANVHTKEILTPNFGFVATCSTTNFKIANLISIFH